MTFKTRLSVLLLSTPVLAFVLIGGVMGNAAADTQDDKLRNLKVFHDVMWLVTNNYVEDVKIDDAMEGALRGLADGLDADSAYLNAAQVAELESGKGLPGGDVGIELTRQYYLRVIAVRDGSPAAEAGLQTGDFIRAIDGKPTRDLSVYVGSRLLRGQPGTKVSLTVLRGNAIDAHEVSLVRAKASTPAVTSRMLEHGVGYVRVPSFTENVPGQVQSQVAALKDSGARAVILDVRRTAEGSIEHGIATARLFVKSGTIATRAGREPEGSSGPRETIAAQPGDGAIEVPVHVLVSAGTSGAAEVFAAALRDNGRAELIGEHTIGRAALQRLVKLPEGRGLWLTYARYIAPSGTAIHGTGLKPDVSVDEPDVEFGATLPSSDPVLEKALEQLKKSSMM